MNLLSDDLLNFLSSATWIFAKTYAKTWPHEYMLKRNEDPELFTEFVRITHKLGYSYNILINKTFFSLIHIHHELFQTP
jgi:hypothetical protein